MPFLRQRVSELQGAAQFCPGLPAGSPDTHGFPGELNRCRARQTVHGIVIHTFFGAAHMIQPALVQRLVRRSCTGRPRITEECQRGVNSAGRRAQRRCPAVLLYDPAQMPSTGCRGLRLRIGSRSPTASLQGRGGFPAGSGSSIAAVLHGGRGGLVESRAVSYSAGVASVTGATSVTTGRGKMVIRASVSSPHATAPVEPVRRTAPPGR